MSKFDNKALVEKLQPILVYVVQSTKTEVDEKIVEELKAAVEGLETADPVDEKEVFEAIFGIFFLVTKVTDNKWDDMAVTALKTVFQATGLADKAEEWLENLKK